MFSAPLPVACRSCRAAQDGSRLAGTATWRLPHPRTRGPTPVGGPWAGRSKGGPCGNSWAVPVPPTLRREARSAEAAPAAPRLVLASAHAGASAAASAAGRPLRVCVVGGGVAGLTSALRLLQLNQGVAATASTASTAATTAATPPARTLEVTVVAAGFGADTTTAGAAGLWGPYKLSGTPEALVCRWGAATYAHLMDLAHSGAAAEAGVSLCAVNSLYPQAEPLPFWHHIPYNFQLLDDRMLRSVGRVASASPSPLSTAPPSTSTPTSTATFSPPPPAQPPPPLPCRWGYHWNSVVCEGAHYLPFLTAAVEAAGGRLQRRRLGALSELDGASVDLVVNAAGLGARELVADGEVYPIRGQILRVRAPWVTQAYFHDPYYIIPNKDTVVLGGTGQQGDSRLEPCPEDRARILQGCTRLLPSLAFAEPVADWVGLRPGRTALRLEADPEGVVLAGGRKVPLVHNYGHGGAGLTLGWGCAADVVELVRRAGGV